MKARPTTVRRSRLSMLTFGAAALLALTAAALVTMTAATAQVAGGTPGTAEAGEARYQANAAARCDVFKDHEEKAACHARVMGYGSTSGSVEGGGVLREVETVVLPPGVDTITIEPKTSSEPVLLVPAEE